MQERGGILWKSLESPQPITPTIIMAIISLLSYHAWNLVERPPNINIVESQWTFRVKGTISDKLTNTRLNLSQGFSQVSGLDFNETFSLLSSCLNVTSELFGYSELLDVREYQRLSDVQMDFGFSFNAAPTIDMVLHFGVSELSEMNNDEIEIDR